MTEYAYRVEMTNEDCHGKRFVVFHDDRYLDFWQAGREAYDHISTDPCGRCGKLHEADSYVCTGAERGEVDYSGAGTSYRELRPGKNTDYSIQQELGL